MAEADMIETERGRPREQRAELAEALIDACVETLGLRTDRLVVEFTQHTGDEMYCHGRGWSVEWTPAEAMTSESLSTETTEPSRSDPAGFEYTV
jgi:phenylpyruvate tautomerase PptA (4-oxalocrotonate tautomerase family)